MKGLLTNYIFKFLFQDYLNIKDGDILKCSDDLFMFDSSNGNQNRLKQYFSYNGFWNYIKAKKGSILSFETKKFVESSKFGFGNEFYKNGIKVANEKEINFYKNSLLIEKHYKIKGIK
jgi:hypothetical protein